MEMLAEKARQAIAYHEAGHAVVWFCHERIVISVTIVPDEECDTLGFCHVTEPPRLPYGSPEDQHSLETETICRLAGGIAESRFLGGAGSDLDSQDLALAQANADEIALISGEDPQDCLKRLGIQARLILECPQNWRAVESIAALLARGTLTGDQARELFLGSRA